MRHCTALKGRHRKSNILHQSERPRGLFEPADDLGDRIGRIDSWVDVPGVSHILSRPRLGRVLPHVPVLHHGLTYVQDRRQRRWRIEHVDDVQLSAAELHVPQRRPAVVDRYATPYTTTTSLDHDLGIYAQDNWTRGRLTLKLGVRYDYTTTGVPAQSLGSGVLVPNRNATFAAQSGLDWKDITPKTGVSYDVFGNGNTAVKAVLSKYLQGQLTGLASSLNPVSTLVTSATRTWNDANHNFVPDCNLQNPAANGECLQLSNANFGTVVPGSTFDPDLLHGWDKRGYNWEFSTSVQQKLSARSSIDVGYFRRWYGNFLVTDNLALAPSDFNTFSIVAPVDPRLPGGGGYTVGPLYNVVPSLFTTPAKNYVTLSDNYGNQIQHWNGIDVNVSDRIGSLLLQGGTSTGRTSTDNCAVLAQIPELSPLAVPYCHQETNWLTQVKFLGSYQVPKIDVLVSGTLQSSPGVAITGNYNVPFSVYGSSLGRVISGGNANSTVQVNLVAPGTHTAIA